MTDGVKKAFITVSFGTTFKAARLSCIESVENALRLALPDYDHFRAFTSVFVRRKLKQLEGLETEGLEELLEKLRTRGYRKVLVQVTHIVSGEEFDEKVVAVAKRFEKSFERLQVGKPLLTGNDDAKRLLAALESEFAVLQPEEFLLLIGHGSTRASNAEYLRFAEFLAATGKPALFGLLEEGCRPCLEDVLAELKAKRITKVRLLPLLLVCGDHVANDLAGTQPESWLNRLAAAGLQVEVVKRGLGENPAVREIYLQHAVAALSESE